MPDHVHMLIKIPPKYSVAEVVGYEEAQVRAYIKNQEKPDAQNEHLDLQNEEEGSF